MKIQKTLTAMVGMTQSTIATLIVIFVCTLTIFVLDWIISAHRMVRVALRET